ncbi:MAG: methyltransferase type 11 [Deltaproteobacteria bacterium]|nr:methyltransferase type 11 [Deltaproteobacteria bacterium]
MDWDERYNEADYAYGTGPNDFLVSIAGRISGGRIWSLAEGEAACLTALGNEVPAVDSAAAGLLNEEALAVGRGLKP